MMGKKLLHVLLLCAVVFSVLPSGVNVGLPTINSGEMGSDINGGEEKREEGWGQAAPSVAAEQPPLVESYFNYTDYNVGIATQSLSRGVIKYGNYIYNLVTGNIPMCFNIIKYDLEGNYLWNKSYAGKMWDFTILNDIIYTVGTNTSLSDVCIFMADLDGNEIDSQMIIADFYQLGLCIENNGQDLFISFYTRFFDTGPNHIGIMRLDTSLNILWNITWNPHSDSYTDVSSKLYINEDYFYIVGQTNKTAVLLKFDLSGNLIFQRFWKTLATAQLSDICIVDSFIYVVGWEWDALSNVFGLFLKYDLNGDLIWEQRLPNYYMMVIEYSEYYLYCTIESSPQSGLVVMNFDGDIITTITRNVVDESFSGKNHFLNDKTFYYSGTIKIGGIFYPRLVAYNITITAPPAPTLEPISPAISDTGIINVNWSDYSAIDGYSLYRDTAPITVPNPALLIATPAESNYTDTLTVNDTYYYAVVAHNSKGSSPLSANAQVEVEIPGSGGPEVEEFAPDAPMLAIDTESPTTEYEVALVWTDVDGADNFTLYRLDVEITNDTLPEAAQTADSLVTIDATTFTDTVPGPGKYYYAVLARNESGVSNLSNSEYILVVEVSDPKSPPAEDDPFIDGYPLLGVAVAAVVAMAALKRRYRR